MDEVSVETSGTSMNESAELLERIEDMKRKVRWAAEVASEAGEFKELAFERALETLFGGTVDPFRLSPAHEKSADSETGSQRRRANGGPRKPAKADAASIERIRSILDSPPELTSEFSMGLAQLQAKFQIYAALDLASNKFGINRLSLAELREVLRQTLRIGMPDGTLRGQLSKAPPSEIGRVTNGSGETEYQLMQAGKEVLNQARQSKTQAD